MVEVIGNKEMGGSRERLEEREKKGAGGWIFDFRVVVMVDKNLWELLGDGAF